MTVYSNPIQREGDFADPFVLRHDGLYYLYCTNPDVRCWSSADLISWQLEGPTIEVDAFPGLVPFAPEVVYADGAFYMYTSPSGHGHYVLKADSPLGPFRPISGNVEHAIDGNVFIDDDGRWYFYWAADEGIWGCEMSSPTEFGDPVFTGIHMNGWTEGPFVSKRDGLYFMTLTGNHYLSKGYRIDAASSKHPLYGYVGDPLNPIVVSTDGTAVGLGHSSSVWGPNLVSTYLVYHNLNADESRDLDLDRQVWSGRNLLVLGPTTSAPVPAEPHVSWRGAAELAAEPAVTAERFTAEFNLIGSAGGGAGVSVGDLTLRVDSASATAIARVSGASESIASRDLPASFVHEALHCWRVEYDHGLVSVYLDARLQFTLKHEIAAGSVLAPVGFANDRIGHCAVTYELSSEADRAAVKPVPGRFWASLGEGALDPLSMSYGLHVQQPGRFTAYLAGEFAEGDVIDVDLDGRGVAQVRVEGASRLVSAPLDLDASSAELTLRAAVGSPTVELVTIAVAPQGDAADFAHEHAEGFGKRLLGDASFDDVVVTARVAVTLEAPGSHADLLVRATQLSEGGDGADAQLGIDFMLGYSLQLHADRVVFARHDYAERVLAEHRLVVDQSRPLAVVLRATGSSFVAEINGIEVIRVDDALPHPLGGVGVRTADALMQVEALQIESVSVGLAPTTRQGR